MARKSIYLVSLDPLQLSYSPTARQLGRVLKRAEYEDRRDQILREIGAAFREAAVRKGLDLKQLARMSGFTNMQKGTGRIKDLMEYGQINDTRLVRCLVGILELQPELDRHNLRIEEEDQRYQQARDEEQAFLATYLRLLLDQADRIRADEELQYTLVSESAFLSMAYIGGGYLPLGTLLEFWDSGRLVSACPECPGQVHLYSLGGSGLSGAGSMFGLCLQCRSGQQTKFDSTTAYALMRHPLFSPFQRRIRQGQFLNLPELVERLGSGGGGVA
jgi:hypothetical protein